MRWNTIFGNLHCTIVSLKLRLRSRRLPLKTVFWHWKNQWLKLRGHFLFYLSIFTSLSCCIDSDFRFLSLVTAFIPCHRLGVLSISLFWEIRSPERGKREVFNLEEQLRWSHDNMTSMCKTILRKPSGIDINRFEELIFIHYARPFLNELLENSVFRKLIITSFSMLSDLHVQVG